MASKQGMGNHGSLHTLRSTVDGLASPFFRMYINKAKILIHWRLLLVVLFNYLIDFTLVCLM